MRRWCSGQHGCLPSNRSGFDSRPTHWNLLFLNYKERTSWTTLYYNEVNPNFLRLCLLFKYWNITNKQHKNVENFSCIANCTTTTKTTVFTRWQIWLHACSLYSKDVSTKYIPVRNGHVPPPFWELAPLDMKARAITKESYRTLCN